MRAETNIVSELDLQPIIYFELRVVEHRFSQI